MKTTLSVALLLLVCTGIGQAKLIESYRMDSLVLFSDVIVYCDEEDVKRKEIPHEITDSRGLVKWTDTITITRCKVLQSFKGDLAAGAEFTIEYGDLFRRYLFEKGPYTVLNAAREVVSVHKAEYFPPGKVLLFLRKDSAAGYGVVDSKLVQDGKVYRYVQMMNPGPLNLCRQGPEDFKLAKVKPYGEEELLRDMTLALKKSVMLKRPVPESIDETMKAAAE